MLAGGQVQLGQAVARPADGHRGVVHRGRLAGVVGHCGDHGQAASGLGGPPQVLGLLHDHCRRQAERQGFLAGWLPGNADPGHRPPGLNTGAPGLNAPKQVTLEQARELAARYPVFRIETATGGPPQG